MKLLYYFYNMIQMNRNVLNAHKHFEKGSHSGEQHLKSFEELK